MTDVNQEQDGIKQLQWWGYIHTNGKIHVKRYFNKNQINDALESSFVEFIFMPFEAKNYSDAFEQISNWIGAA